VIQSFRHKGLKQFFTKGSARGISVQLSGRIRRVLDAIDAAESPSNLTIPGFGTHRLKGNRGGTWAIAISYNWRITFQFRGIHTTETDLEGYH
jgi:proteic killer suppression protein